MRSHPLRSQLLALSLAMAAALPLAARPQKPSSVFGETVEVRVINIEVVVTDKDGQPVFGLAPQDFRLRVDGEEVPIDYFTEVQGGTAVERQAAEGGPSGLPDLAPGQAVSTSYLVYIDDYFSIARDRNQVLGRLIEQLPLLQTGDRMAVVAYDGRSATMLSSWTASTGQLKRAFEAARQRPARGLARLSELRSFESGQRLAGSFRVSRYGLTVDEEHYADRLTDQVSRSVRSAAATLRSFASPPGRKVALLLSGGWPYDIDRYAVDDEQRPLLERRSPPGDELFRPLVETANLLGYTLYTVDLPGLAGTSGAEASNAASQVLRGNVREREVEDSLDHMAVETGGRALVNAGRLAAFEDAVQDTRSYYWLGYTSNAKGDDQHHDIRVEVRRPGLKVRTREGFHDLSRQREVELAVESTLLFGNPPGFDSLPLHLGEVQRNGRRYLQAKVSMAIPAAALTLVTQGDAWVGEIEIRAAAIDEDGNQSEVPALLARLKVPQKPQAGQVVPYSWTLKLRRARQRVVVAVYDRVSGRILAGSVEVKP